jgi:hypothetical protein
MTPKWLLKVMWFGAGVGGTGAFWYFLSQRHYPAAALTVVLTVVDVVIAVALRVRNDRLRGDQQSVTAALSPALERPALGEPQVYLQERSANEVVSRINALNPLERDLVARHTYVEHWVRWSGEVLRIESSSSFLEGGAFTVMVGDHVLGHAVASLEFLSAERHLVETLEEGDRISYEAKITRVLGAVVFLADVTFVQTDERSAVDVTPEYLMHFFEGHTDMQARARVADFIGKWMQVSGPLGNVSPELQVSFADKSPVHMFFHKKKWGDRLLTLSRGDNITVIGQIAYVERGNLVLYSCELMGS